MTTRRRTGLVAGLVALAIAAGVAGGLLARLLHHGRGSGTPAASVSPIAPRPDDGPYRPSDPGRLAATGRPQLVEFYHRA